MSSQSTLRGAVGEAKQNYPKTQRTNTKIREPNVVNTYQNQLPHQVWKEQEVSHPDSYLQGRHNTTTYMNLPNSIQNKTCGRCGLVGHIKKQCREEVYCKFCRNSSHSIRACRTYANFLRADPVTSSRKNTPEKRMTEDIDREIAIRVQQEMKRILTDLETNRQVNQSSHQQISTRASRVQNLIGNYQRPPEVLENAGNVQNRVNMGQQPQETYSILNQRWEDPPHMQAPMAPMNLNDKSNAYQKMEPPYPIVNVPVNLTMVTNRQVEINGPGVNPKQPNNTNNNHRSHRSGILSTNMMSRGVEQAVFNGQMLENREQREDVNIDYRGNTYTKPVNRDSMQDKSLQDSRRSNKKSGNSGESEAGIKRVLLDDGIFTNLVKDSITAHVREGIRPMFVNNYYVGDNSWKPGATEGNTKTTQEVDTSTNRSNMAVQTAISSLGEDCK